MMCQLPVPYIKEREQDRDEAFCIYVKFSFERESDNGIS
jgi:hypothetical protein